MSNDYLKKLATELKETRESKKQTIEQIFTKTRIDKKYLIAIEDGNFSIMPEVYIRAFIKEYSKTIGLDPNEILTKFDKAKSGVDYEVTQIEVEKTEEKNVKEEIKTKISQVSQIDSQPDHKEPENKSNKPLYYTLVAVILLLTIFISYKYFLNDENNEIITEKPFDEIVESQNNIVTSSIEEQKLDESQKINPNSIEAKKVELISPTQKIVTNEPVVNQAIIPGELNLTIVGSDKSWIRVVSDEKNNTEFIIDKGVTKVLNAKNKFFLHIGNSGGVRIYLNNKELEFKGAPNRVRKFSVTANGIEYLRRTPKLNVNQ